MAENSIVYGTSQFLLDHILVIPQSTSYKHSYLIEDLEQNILRIITERKMESSSVDLLSGLANDLSTLGHNLEQELKNASSQQVLRIRTHQLAIAKILVFTYAKSDFKLASAHFHQGRAYFLCKSYEQAVNHLTIASTKVSKISDIKQSKLYNSFILTTLGACYYEIERYDYTFEVLLRAFDIQNSSQSQKNNFISKLTLQLLARTYLKHRSFDGFVKKQKEEVRIKHQQEAVRLIDKLIDVLRDQFNDFQSAYSKALHLSDTQRKSADSQQNTKKQMQVPAERLQVKKKGEQGELVKLIEFIYEKLQLLMVDFDRSPIRAALKLINGNELRRSEGLDSLCQSLRQLLQELSQSLKKQRIFKFKILLSCALVTNSTDQQLKYFMKEYEDDENAKNRLKRLKKQEKIQIYKLLLSYAIRFSDSENQLLYLKKLQEMYLQEGETSQNQMQLLNIRKCLSKLYSQMHMETESAEVLIEIKALQQKLFGPTSKPVRKTQSMLKLIKKESECQDNLQRGELPNNKLRLRKTVVVSNHSHPLHDI